LAPCPQLSFGSHDPDAVTELVAALAPGVRVQALAARGFDFRGRAWAWGGGACFDYAAARGRALFPEGRSYLALGVALHGAFEFRTGRRSLYLSPGEAHLLTPDASGEIVPVEGAHVLGVALDPALVEAHREETGPGRETRGHWPNRLSSRTDAGRRLFRYLDEFLGELVQPTSPLHLPLAALEARDTLAALVAAACRVPESATASVASDALGARAEELLAAQLRRPVSLAEVAASLDTSVRTLSRAFQKRRGMGPIAFLRRRRLEAARHDLLVAEPGERRVTEVALRYGFAHLGRFAVDYRRLFGESPSETLRVPGPTPVSRLARFH
jgi:AraC-like DNA-binding protein